MCTQKHSILNDLPLVLTVTQVSQVLQIRDVYKRQVCSLPCHERESGRVGTVNIIQAESRPPVESGRPLAYTKEGNK